MQKKSALKKSQPKAKKPDAGAAILDRINQKLDHMEQILDRIAEILAEKDNSEDSPDTPDEAA